MKHPKQTAILLVAAAALVYVNFFVFKIAHNDSEVIGQPGGGLIMVDDFTSDLEYGYPMTSVTRMSAGFENEESLKFNASGIALNLFIDLVILGAIYLIFKRLNQNNGKQQ